MISAATVLLALSIPAPAVAVTGPAQVSFRTVRVGDTIDVSTAFTVANGERIAAARIEGSDQFEILDDGCAGTPPAGRCRVTVRFAPTSTGPFPATLHVGEAVVRLRASAYGIGPSLEVSPTGLSWPEEAVDSERTARLINSGDEPIRVTGFAVTGRDAGLFTLTPADCAGRELAPAEQCVIGVRLQSPGGSRQAELQIGTELPQAPYAVELRTGTTFTGRPRPVCPCATTPGHNQNAARPSWSFGIVGARFVNRVVTDVYTSLAARLTVTVFRGTTAVKSASTSGRVTGRRGVEVRVALKRGGYRVRVIARRPGDSRTTWGALTVR